MLNKSFYNIAVFASGYGSNFKNLVDTSYKLRGNTNYIPSKIRLLITDKKDINAIKIAKDYNILRFTINDTKNSSQKILSLLAKYEIDIILLAGYLKILKAEIIDQYPLRIINIHPSLLPKYKGLNSIEKVWEAKEDISGVSIHYVNNDLDAGAIIFQEQLKVDVDFFTFKENTHKLEHKMYSKFLSDFLQKNKALVVSKCLLGVNSRYDGFNKLNKRALRFVEKYDAKIFFICPESDGGMQTPREPIDDKLDLPFGVKSFVNKLIMELKPYSFIEFLLKENSPSCGVVKKEGEVFYQVKEFFKNDMSKKIIFITENDL